MHTVFEADILIIYPFTKIRFSFTNPAFSRVQPLYIIPGHKHFLFVPNKNVIFT